MPGSSCRRSLNLASIIPRKASPRLWPWRFLWQFSPFYFWWVQTFTPTASISFWVGTTTQNLRSTPSRSLPGTSRSENGRIRRFEPPCTASIPKRCSWWCAMKISLSGKRPPCVPTLGEAILSSSSSTSGIPLSITLQPMESSRSFSPLTSPRFLVSKLSASFSIFQATQDFLT